MRNPNRRAVRHHPRAEGPSAASPLGTEGGSTFGGTAADASVPESHPMICTLGDLERLLHEAGAPVSLLALATWSVTQKSDAVAWARAQLAARAADPPGTSTSVHWPAHVSAAVYGTR
jgi:hypothetical protein